MSQHWQRRTFPKGLGQKTINRKKRKTSILKQSQRAIKQVYKDMPDIDRHRQEYLDQWKHRTPSETGYMRREPGLWLIRCFMYSLFVVPLRFMTLASISGYMGAWVAARSQIGWEFILVLVLGIAAWKGCGRISVLIFICIGFFGGNNISLKLATELMYEREVAKATAAMGSNIIFSTGYCVHYKDIQDTQSCLMLTYALYISVVYVVVWILTTWCIKLLFNHLKEHFLGE